MRLEQKMVQKQIQRLSQVQITALNYLTLENTDLRDVIYREINNNPALEVVREPVSKMGGGNYIDHSFSSFGNSADSDKFQQLLENQENYGETLQEHLLYNDPQFLEGRQP